MVYSKEPYPERLDLAERITLHVVEYSWAKFFDTGMPVRELPWCAVDMPELTKVVGGFDSTGELQTNIAQYIQRLPTFIDGPLAVRPILESYGTDTYARIELRPWRVFTSVNAGRTYLANHPESCLVHITEGIWE